MVITKTNKSVRLKNVLQNSSEANARKDERPKAGIWLVLSLSTHVVDYGIDVRENDSKLRHIPFETAII